MLQNVTQCYTLHIHTHLTQYGGVKTEIQCDNAETVSTDNVWSTRSTPYQDEKQCSDVVMFVLHITLHLDANDARWKNNVLTWWWSFFTSQSISIRTMRVHRDNGAGSEISSTNRATDVRLAAGSTMKLFTFTYCSSSRSSRCSECSTQDVQIHVRRVNGVIHDGSVEETILRDSTLTRGDNVHLSQRGEV